MISKKLEEATSPIKTNQNLRSIKNYLAKD